MRYLDSDYSLRPVDSDAYRAQAQRIALLKSRCSLTETMEMTLSEESPSLIDYIRAYGRKLQEAYAIGSGFYALSAAVGITALREANSLDEVPPIQPDDWRQMTAREAELHGRPGIATLEEVAGIGMLEIRGVNTGYVDGYEAAYGDPTLRRFLGFTGLGNLNAHDLMHFASLRAS